MKTEYKYREWIENAYLPSLKGQVLIVGVNAATQHYCKLVNEPNKCATIDSDPEIAKYGSPAMHIIEDFLVLDDRKYDNISIYGLDKKYVPDDEKSWLEWSKKLLIKANSLLKDGGTLFFGGYMSEGWKELLHLPELGNYEELYFVEDNIDGKTCLKWWIRKND